MMAEVTARNGEGLAKLISEQGVKLREFNDDVYDAFGEAAEEVFAETRKHSPLAAKIHDSFAKLPNHWVGTQRWGLRQGC